MGKNIFLKKTGKSYLSGFFWARTESSLTHYDERVAICVRLKVKSWKGTIRRKTSFFGGGGGGGAWI